MTMFADLKVLDFSWGAALPLATKALAHYGATVVSVESLRRPTLTRLLPPYHGGMPGVDQSAMFANFGTSKLSISLDMGNPEGRDIARRLATEWADVVAESFGPGIMRRWGMTYDDLRAARPGPGDGEQLDVRARRPVLRIPWLRRARRGCRRILGHHHMARRCSRGPLRRLHRLHLAAAHGGGAARGARLSRAYGRGHLPRLLAGGGR